MRHHGKSHIVATFIWTNKLWLPCETSYPHVFLSVDWTATDLPATIEGACLSGNQAAKK